MNQPRAELVESLRDLLKVAMPSQLNEQVELINALREVIHEASPFAEEPVDLIRWVPADSVHSNDYNPNAVAPPEMELLRLSIMADGYTQPIVTNLDDDSVNRTVIDGFHRNRVGKECEDVATRIRGYLPVVQIKGDRTDRGDRIASTIRHNRARGKHAVSAMADIVLELKRRNWSDKKIGIQLGMDDDEVLRLAQITGLAEAFANRDFSKSWEAVLSDQDSDDLDDAALTSLTDVDGELSDPADADA
jgi:ParB-like chromosome segregation protein Spo0J